MPDRIVRDELLTSERYWSVPEAAQLLFHHLLLIVDDFGNVHAGHFTIRSKCYAGRHCDDKVIDKLLGLLADVDLIRMYQVSDAPYLHIPRFRQRLRHFTNRYPGSEWDQIKDLPKKPPDARQSDVGRTSAEVKRSEVKRSEEKKTLPRSAEKAAKGTRLKDDWIPPRDWFEWCEQERPDLNSTETYNAFHDYWIAKPGKDGLKLDWEATWRNWVRNSKTGVNR